MTFTGTISAVNAALDGLSFLPSANFSGSGSVQIITDDQGNTGLGEALSDTDSVSITVNAANDAPVNTVPASRTIDEDDSLYFSGDISISDVDATGDVEVTLTATHGVLSMSYTSGLTFTTGDGYDDAIMTFTGTIGAINSALIGLEYTPDADYNGSALVQIETDDLAGGTDTDSVSITIDAVNDAPVANVPGYQVAYQNGTLIFSTANGNLVSVGDVDNTSLEVTLSVTLGTLTLSGTSGLTFSAGDGTADATMTFFGHDCRHQRRARRPPLRRAGGMDRLPDDRNRRRRPDGR